MDMHGVEVLLVEDDADDERLFRRYAKRFDGAVTIHAVCDGDTALSWLMNCSTIPQLIALDLNLPRVTGRQVLHRVKSHPIWREIPVVIISGTSWEREQQLCHAFGADAFLHKPYDGRDLVRLLDQIRAKSSTLKPSDVRRIG